MFTADLVNLYNRNIFETSLYIFIFQDEKCRLLRNLSLSYQILTPFIEEKIQNVLKFSDVTKEIFISVTVTVAKFEFYHFVCFFRNNFYY